MRYLRIILFNPFVPIAPFLYPLKTSENRKVFFFFHGVEKGCIVNEWVKLNVYKTFRRHPGSLLDFIHTFYLFPVSNRLTHESNCLSTDLKDHNHSENKYRTPRKKLLPQNFGNITRFASFKSISSLKIEISGQPTPSKK